MCCHVGNTFAMASKRKRVYAGRPATKRRRTMKRKMGRRSSKRGTMSYTSRSLNAVTAFKPQSKRLSRSRWRNVLWRDTLAMEHYKSIASFALPLSSAAGYSELSMNSIGVFDSAANLEFWKIAGGLQDSGFGFVPLWGQPNGAGIPELVSLVIRGGRFFITISNPSLTDNVKVRIQLVHQKQQLRNFDDTANSNTALSWISAISTPNRPLSWSIQQAPDYGEYFYPPVVDRSVDLKPGDDVNIIQKIKTVKIDCDKYRRAGGFFPLWIVYLNQNTDNTAGAETVRVVQGYNLSFAVTDSNVG